MTGVFHIPYLNIKESDCSCWGSPEEKESFPWNNLFNNFDYDLQTEVFLNFSLFFALNLGFIAPKGMSGI